MGKLPQILQCILIVLAISGMLGCFSPSSPQFILESPSSVLEAREPLELPHIIGFLPFDSSVNGAEWEWLPGGLSDMLITDLAAWPDIKIVSRQLLGEVLREQWIQHRGMSDPDMAVKIGQLSGARFLVKGRVYPFNSNITVDIHIIDVESGLVVRTIRATGTHETIPALARQLAQNLGRMFGYAVNNGVQNTASQRPMVSLKTRRHAPVEKPSVGGQTVDLLAAPQTQLSPVDVALTLDRTQRLREEAWLLAEEVWHRGLFIELTPPSIVYPEHMAGEELREAILSVPLLSYFLPDNLVNIHQSLEFSFLTREDKHVGRGNLIWQGNGVVNSRLFAEWLRSPHRLFVRAISETGEIVGVTSPGLWRVERNVTIEQDGSLSLSTWPEHFIEGEAEFSTTILDKYQAIGHFDAVIVPVPGERRIISVEPIQSVNEKRISKTNPGHGDRTLQEEIKKWFLENWMPPVMESLPVQGYLPGNRRVLQLRVFGRNRLIQDVQLIQAAKENFLAADMRALIPRLVGQCFTTCGKYSTENESQEEPFAFRIQLDLIKDLQYVGLGENEH
ncbi:MAG: CsgG/HfaB family protein [Nitrospirales bacterium]